MSKRGGLGRGLSALIPGAPEAGETGDGLLEVPANAIAPNPKQPRSRFDDETLAELAASIREVGILQPIVVRRTGAGYEVVAGERRLRAAKLAGLATVPVVLRDSEDADLLREALIENIHREDLNPIELGDAFRQLLDDLGLKQEELADRVGVSRSHIANTIRLLSLPVEVQQLVADEKLTAGHARALLALADAEGMTTLAAPRGGRGSRSAKPRRSSGGSSKPRPASPRAAGRDRRKRRATRTWRRWRRSLSEQLATRVVIRMNRKRGQVVIEFGSADDLERIVSEIVGSGSRPRPRLSDDVIHLAHGGAARAELRISRSSRAAGAAPAEARPGRPWGTPGRRSSDDQVDDRAHHAGEHDHEDPDQLARHGTRNRQVP